MYIMKHNKMHLGRPKDVGCAVKFKSEYFISCFISCKCAFNNTEFIAFTNYTTFISQGQTTCVSRL